MKTRIIGLGNTLLTDDGAGVYAAREIERCLASREAAAGIDVMESEVAGFALLEAMAGWERVILIDSLQFDGLEPGTVVRIEPQDLRTSLRIRSVHEIDLPTVLELGRRLGFRMPREVTIFGIQADDAYTFGESLTPSGERGMKEAVSRVLREVLPPSL